MAFPNYLLGTLNLNKYWLENCIHNLMTASIISWNEEKLFILSILLSEKEGCDRESATSIKHLYVTVIALNLSDMGGLQDNRVFTQ